MKIKDVSQFEKLPGAMLQDITDRQEPAEPTRTETAAAPSMSQETISDNAIMQTGQGFEAEINNPFAAAAEAPKAATFPKGDFRPFPDAETSANGFPAFAGNGQGTRAGDLITGKFATDMLDAILPAVSVYLFDAVGYKLNKRGLQLSADEKKVIAPAMQRYLETVNINFDNPLYNLLFVVGAVYGAKVIEQLPNIEKAEKPGSKSSTRRAAEAAPVDNREALIQKVMKARKKGRQDAIDYLTKKTQAKRDGTN